MDKKNYCEHCYFKFKVFKNHPSEACNFQISSKTREESKGLIDKKIKKEQLKKYKNILNVSIPSQESPNFSQAFNIKENLNLFSNNNSSPSFYQSFFENPCDFYSNKNDLIKNVLDSVNLKIEKNQNIILKKLESLEQHNITLERSIRKVLSPKVLQDTENESEKIRLNLIRKKKEIEKSLKSLNNSKDKMGAARIANSSTDDSSNESLKKNSFNKSENKLIKLPKKKVLKKKILFKDNEKTNKRFSSSSNDSNINLNDHLSNITKSVDVLGNSVSKFNSIVDNLDLSANNLNDSLSNFGDLISNLNSSLNLTNEYNNCKKTQSEQKSFESSILSSKKNEKIYSPKKAQKKYSPKNIESRNSPKKKEKNKSPKTIKTNFNSKEPIKSSFQILKDSKPKNNINLNNQTKSLSESILKANRLINDFNSDIYNSKKYDEYNFFGNNELNKHQNFMNLNSTFHNSFKDKNDKSENSFDEDQDLINYFNNSNKSFSSFDKENSFKDFEKNDKKSEYESLNKEDKDILKEINKSNEMNSNKLKIKKKIKDKIFKVKNEVKKVKLTRKKIKKDRLKRKLKRRAIIKKNLLIKKNKIKKNNSQLDQS